MFFCTGSSSSPTTSSASWKLCSSQKVRRTRSSFWECCGSETLQLLSHSEVDISKRACGHSDEGLSSQPWSTPWWTDPAKLGAQHPPKAAIHGAPQREPAHACCCQLSSRMATQETRVATEIHDSKHEAPNLCFQPRLCCRGVRHNFTNVILLPGTLKASPSWKSLQNVSIGFRHEETLEEGEQSRAVLPSGTGTFRNFNILSLTGHVTSTTKH